MTLIILSAPRSGYHMVTSMLREDLSLHVWGNVIDARGTLASWAPYTADRRKGEPVIGCHYAYLEYTAADALAVLGAVDRPRVLVLHRRDLRAQYASLAFARLHPEAFACDRPVHGAAPEIDETDFQVFASRVSDELAWLRANPPFAPYDFLAYEDITASALTAVEALIGRAVRIVEPATVRLAPH